MTTDAIRTEDRILSAACSIFLLYGYHGTTIIKIANEAGVSKSIVHYYYRSKDKLYSKTLEIILDTIVSENSEFNSENKVFEKIRWFFSTELYNNRIFLEETLKNMTNGDKDKYLEKIKKLIGID